MSKCYWCNKRPAHYTLRLNKGRIIYLCKECYDAQKMNFKIKEVKDDTK